MEKITTGFSVNPLVGSLRANQLMGRYIKTKYFIDLLNSKSLWFTRINNWQLIDPCEAELLPVFKKHLRASHRSSEYEYNFHKSLVDLSLKSSFGCCFTLYENYENDHMWQVFTPEVTDFGVLIIIKAIDLYNSLLNLKYLYPCQYFSKVKYINDAKAKSMQPRDCTHSNKETFQYEESHFLKRISYSNEKEVRAVLSSEESKWSILLHQYLKINKIPYYPIDTPQPKDCIGIKMMRSMVIRCPNDRVVFLNKEQGEGFINFIENYYNNSVSTGVNVPFDYNYIQKIIIHPRLNKGHDVYKAIQAEIENKKIGCEIIDSGLYKQAW